MSAPVLSISPRVLSELPSAVPSVAVSIADGPSLTFDAVMTSLEEKTIGFVNNPEVSEAAPAQSNISVLSDSFLPYDLLDQLFAPLFMGEDTPDASPPLNTNLSWALAEPCLEEATPQLLTFSTPNITLMTMPNQNPTTPESTLETISKNTSAHAVQKMPTLEIINEKIFPTLNENKQELLEEVNEPSSENNSIQSLEYTPFNPANAAALSATPVTPPLSEQNTISPAPPLEAHTSSLLQNTPLEPTVTEHPGISMKTPYDAPSQVVIENTPDALTAKFSPSLTPFMTKLVNNQTLEQTDNPEQISSDSIVHELSETRPLPANISPEVLTSTDSEAPIKLTDEALPTPSTTSAQSESITSAIPLNSGQMDVQTGQDGALSANTLSTQTVAGSERAIDEPTIFKTVFKHLNTLPQTPGETHLRIQLYPEELGVVDVRIDIDKIGSSRVHFTAENQSVHDVLIGYRHDIQHIFEAANLSLDSNNLSFLMQSDQQQNTKEGYEPETHTSTTIGPIDEPKTDEITLSTTTSQLVDVLA